MPKCVIQKIELPGHEEDEFYVCKMHPNIITSIFGNKPFPKCVMLSSKSMERILKEQRKEGRKA